jgi:hypothetical protein
MGWGFSTKLKDCFSGNKNRRDDGYLDLSSDEMSQIFTVLSPLPLTIRFPSGLDVRARFPCGDVAAKMRR